MIRRFPQLFLYFQSLLAEARDAAAMTDDADEEESNEGSRYWEDQLPDSSAPFPNLGDPGSSE